MRSHSCMGGNLFSMGSEAKRGHYDAELKFFFHHTYGYAVKKF